MGKESVFTGVPDNVPKPPVTPVVELPEQLRGKSPTEMYAIMSEAHKQELQTAVTTAKAEVDGQIKTLTERIENISKGPAPVTRPAARPAVGPSARPNQEIPDQYTDPEGFMDYQFRQRVGPLVDTTVKSMRESNRLAFASRVPEYEELKDEIETLLNTFSPEAQMQPQSYEVAYRYAKASHFDEFADKRAKQLASDTMTRVFANMGLTPEQIKDALAKQGVTEPAPNPPATPSPPNSLFQGNVGVPVVSQTGLSTPIAPTGPKAGTKKLSALQKEMADEFDMTPEEYNGYKELNTDLMSQLGGKNE